MQYLLLLPAAVVFLAISALAARSDGRRLRDLASREATVRKGFSQRSRLLVYVGAAVLFIIGAIVRLALDLLT